MGNPYLTINRRHMRTQQLLGLVLHHIRPYLDPNPERRVDRDVARVLEELFHTSGIQIITEADRAAAGLPPRDHNGMTLEELAVYEARMMEAMLQPLQMMIMPDGRPAAEQVFDGFNERREIKPGLEAS